MGPKFLPSSNWLELTILCKGHVLYFNHLHGLCWHLSLQSLFLFEPQFLNPQDRVLSLNFGFCVKIIVCV